LYPFFSAFTFTIEYQGQKSGVTKYSLLASSTDSQTLSNFYSSLPISTSRLGSLKVSQSHLLSIPERDFSRLSGMSHPSTPKESKKTKGASSPEKHFTTPSKHYGKWKEEAKPEPPRGFLSMIGRLIEVLKASEGAAGA
jgi:hypothetical protein